jgi:hypothetical protein
MAELKWKKVDSNSLTMRQEIGEYEVNGKVIKLTSNITGTVLFLEREKERYELNLIPIIEEQVEKMI